jgi:hypothetical protein
VTKYHVALSFAGEDRQYVEKVAEQLRLEGVDVFYDKYEEANLWGKDLYAHLTEVYEKTAIFTVMFISEAYKNKIWTNHERRAAQARAIENAAKEYILPAFFDEGVEVPGLLKTTGHVSLANKTPDQLAQLIVEKLVNDGVELRKQFSYGEDAKSDVDFPLQKGQPFADVILALKSHTWPTQAPAIRAVFDLDWPKLTPEEIFVLGRNIYQCADGNENEARAVMHDLRRKLAQLPADAAIHLLNGMFFEVYFNSRGEFRRERKGKFLEELLELQEVKKFEPSIAFIRRALKPYASALPFLPNTKPEIVSLELSVKQSDPPLLQSLKFQGRELLRSDEELDAYDSSLWRLAFVTFTVAELKEKLAAAWSIPLPQLQIVCTPEMDAKTEYRLPKGFSIRWQK